MIGCVAVEVKEMGELFANRFLVVAKCLLVDELALLRLHGGVANHTSSAANQCDGAVTSTLEVLEHHNAH